MSIHMYALILTTASQLPKILAVSDLKLMQREIEKEREWGDDTDENAATMPITIYTVYALAEVFVGTTKLVIILYVKRSIKII